VTGFHAVKKQAATSKRLIMTTLKNGHCFGILFDLPGLTSKNKVTQKCHL
jgi:hypothetical protein